MYNFVPLDSCIILKYGIFAFYDLVTKHTEYDYRREKSAVSSVTPKTHERGVKVVGYRIERLPVVQTKDYPTKAFRD